MKKLMVVGMLLVAGVVSADQKIDTSKPFYVYSERGSRDNHGCPSGWMGSAKSMKMNPNYTVGPKEGLSCIRIDYDLTKDPEVQWAGIYWMTPCDNWGTKANAGFDLTGYKKLTFWAKGTGYIDKFGVGGITGQTEEGDTLDVSVDGVDLTPEWKQYTIDLKGQDLSHIIGPFVFAANVDSNYTLKAVTIMLDEIRFEK